MRISDWSADVCSSDLGNAFAVVFVARRGFAAFGGSADEVGPSARLVATFGVESLHAFDVADQIGWCDALQQRAQIGVGMAVVERHIRHAGERDRKSVVSGKGGTGRVDLGGRRI